MDGARSSREANTRNVAGQTIPAIGQIPDNPVLGAKASEPSVTIDFVSAAGPDESVAHVDKEEPNSPNDDPLSPQRSRAEENLKSVAIKLQKAMSKDNGVLQIPDAISLRNLDRIEEVEATGKQLELAVEALIVSRKELRADRGVGQMVKDCIKSWFNASFPYVKQTIKVVRVRPLDILIDIFFRISFQAPTRSL